MEKRKQISLANQIGLNKVASSTGGTGNRSAKKALLRKYKKYFTETERKDLQKLSIAEINHAIDLKVGKFK